MKQLTTKEKTNLINGCIRHVLRMQREGSSSYICAYLKDVGYNMEGKRISLDTEKIKSFFKELHSAIMKNAYVKGEYNWEHDSHAERLTMLRDLKKKLQTKKS